MTEIDYENPWKYNDQPVGDDMVQSYQGFVYLITNRSTGRKYIGKKWLTKTKTKQIKGKKKKTLVSSDWKTYYGSNKELQIDVAAYGQHQFERCIIRFCKTKGECSYWEAKYQFDNDVLTSDEWYNTWIMVRVHKKHMKFNASVGQ